MIDPGNRTIPKVVMDYADHMNKAHMKPSKIYRNLVEECRKLDIPITFMKKDVANLYPSENKSLDCSQCIEHLQQCKKDDDTLNYSFYTEEDGTLERIFFVLKDGKDILLQQGSETVILFDTKHGTNQYGHKLGCFCTIDAHGKTRIIAAVFLLFEDEDSFMWAFKAFQEAFSVAPKNLFTDQDIAMGRAIATVWSITIHLLCTFHIWKNFWKHIKPLFGENRTVEWREVAKHWWKLCKNSDTTAITSFDSDWSSFVTYIKENGNMEKFDNNKKTWLDGLRDLAPKWAACYTWQHQSYGIHSTQRAEAANSVIASFCSKNSKILTITDDLEQLADTQGLQSEVDKIRKTIFCDAMDKDLSPLAMFLTKGLHPWAKRLVVGQDDQKVHYQCKEVPGTAGVFWVERMAADLTCFTTKEDQKE
jgi:MULE transposase domain